MFHTPWSGTSAATGSLFNMGKNTSRNFYKHAHSQFRRNIHSNSTFKRPKPTTKKWGVFDEMKLISYSSHLAFFMLLPPIIQMYTTKVEVTRDDTIDESPFHSSLDLNSKLILKNINFLDVLEMEKKRLVDLYLSNNIREETEQQRSSDILDSAQTFAKQQHNLQYRPEKKNAVTYQLDKQLKLIDNVYSALQQNNMTSKEYFTNIERITDNLIGIKQQNKRIINSNDTVNNLIKKIFDQLHNLQFYRYESILFRRLLTSYKQPDFRILNIRNKIINEYEKSKQMKNKGRITYKEKEISINHEMNVSIWLRSYIKNFERFSQLVEMFATTNQTRKAFNVLFNMGLGNASIRREIRENPNERYMLISNLKALKREKEALVLEKRIRKILAH